jgi:hypothetical protein
MIIRAVGSERFVQKEEGGQFLGRLLTSSAGHAGVSESAGTHKIPLTRLLEHVLLTLAIGLEGWARRLDRGVEILDGMAAFLTHAVAELESLDFADRTHVQPTLVGATRRGAGRGDDLSRIVILGGFRIRILDDVLRQPVRSFLRTLLPDIAADSSQRCLLSFGSRSG